MHVVDPAVLERGIASMAVELGLVSSVKMLLDVAYAAVFEPDALPMLVRVVFPEWTGKILRPTKASWST